MNASSTNKKIISLEKFTSFLEIIVKKIQQENKFKPDTILALSTEGFPMAAAIAKRIGIKSRNVIGIPVYKDEVGDYYLDDKLISLGNFTNKQVLVVDDSSKRGILLRKVITAVKDRGGKAKSCVLIAWKDGIQPDYVAQTCNSEPPDFYWEH